MNVVELGAGLTIRDVDAVRDLGLAAIARRAAVVFDAMQVTQVDILGLQAIAALHQVMERDSLPLRVDIARDGPVGAALAQCGFSAPGGGLPAPYSYQELAA